MKHAEVRKGSGVWEGDPKAGHAERRLREPQPFLRRRDDESRMGAVGSGVNDRVARSILVDGDVGRRIYHVLRRRSEGDGMWCDRVLVIPFDRLADADFDVVVEKRIAETVLEPPALAVTSPAPAVTPCRELASA